MESTSVAIIIPAYNESATILKAISIASNYGHPIVVNHCSSDATSRIASSTLCTLIDCEINVGYDAALKRGIVAAHLLSFQYYAFFDADCEISEVSLELACNSLATNDCVFGIRSKFPRLSEQICALLSRFLWNIPDPYCGLKAGKVIDLLSHIDAWSGDLIGLFPIFVLKRSRQKRVAFVQCDTTVERSRQPRFGSGFRADTRLLLNFAKVFIRIFRQRL